VNEVEVPFDGLAVVESFETQEVEAMFQDLLRPANYGGGPFRQPLPKKRN
jgi:hypothetical protein